MLRLKEVNVEHKVFNIVTNNAGKNFISIAFLFILNVAFNFNADKVK